MVRLKGMAPRIGGLPPRVAAMPKVADRFYQSAEWRALVASIKASRGNWCEVCGAGGRVIGDHIVEIKDGGAQLDPGNVQLLCHAHHQAKTARARADRASRSARGGG